MWATDKRRVEAGNGRQAINETASISRWNFNQLRDAFTAAFRMGRKGRMEKREKATWMGKLNKKNCIKWQRFKLSLRQKLQCDAETAHSVCERV